MKKKKLVVDDYDLKLIIKALNELRTQLISESRPTDSIDDLLLKTISVLEK